MDSYDKIEELLLAEGYSKEEIPSIMVSLVEQGFDPLQVFATGLGNMLGFNKKSKTPTPKIKPKFTTTQQVGGSLGQRSVSTVKDLGGSVAPDGWGGFKKQPTPATTPSLRPGGQTPVPNFKVSNTPTPRTPVPSAPATTPLRSAVTSTASKGAGLFSRLKGVAGGAFKFLGNPYVTAASIIGDDIMSRGVADGTVTGQPDYKPDWRTPGYKSPTPAEPEKTKVTAPKVTAPEPTKTRSAGQLSAAAKDFDKTFAAKRDELKRVGKNPSSGTFTWRGKSYNTKLKGE